jgi:hypothetical protein
VALAANAADLDGGIARVEFYRDATRVAIDTSAPYTATLTGLAAGSYTITATAVDNLGAAATSVPAIISVTAAAPASATTSMAPRADTYVRGGAYATTNYGTKTTLYVKRWSTPDHERQTYLSFDLTAPVAGRRVRLRLKTWLTNASTTPSPVRAAVYAVSSTTWTDGSFTYNTRPASKTTPLASFSVTSRTAYWQEIDVTTYVQAERALGRTRVAFALKGVENTSAIIALTSRETSDRPVLVVQ